jgi:flavin-binding protein dodecin
MLVSKANELIGTSPQSFEGAVKDILARANCTLRGVHGIEVIGKTIVVEPDGTLDYRVRAYLQFDMAPPDNLHL